MVSVSSKKEGFRDLFVWQKSINLAGEIILLLDTFPPKKSFGLKDQIERAAVSVASNIAEGSGRNGKQEFIYHLGVAKGSLYELETQIIIANKVGYIPDDITSDLINNIQEISRMVNGLKTKINKNLKLTLNT